MKALTCSTVLLCFLAFQTRAINIPTSKMENGRSGANLAESTLTPSNVNVNQFGKLFERAVDGELYCQPLIIEGLNIGGQPRTVVFVVTVKNVAYAFDAEDATATTPLWVNNFGKPVPAADVQPCCTDYSTWVGTAGTPVIDVANNLMYFVTKQKDTDGTYHHRLRKISILTGAEQTGSGLDITATYLGLAFNAKLQNQRSAMLLQNGLLYICSGSHNDAGLYHGWIIAYNVSTMTQAAVFCTSPNGAKDGIWMSGGGPVGDGTKVFVTTGNGDFNLNTGGNNYGNAFIAFNSTLVPQSWFTPADFRNLNRTDLDLGGCGVMMIPGTRLLVSGGKDGKLYLVNADNMGGYTSGADACVQSFYLGYYHMHGGPVHFNSAIGQLVYAWPEGGKLDAYKFENGLFNVAPVWQSAMNAPNGMPGGHLSVSANGTADGIVWATLPWAGDAAMQVQPGVLRAFNAVTGTELYNTHQNVGRDDFGNFAKNPSVVVNNGRVYVPTFSGKLAVYGLLPVGGPPPTPTGVTATSGDQQITVSWTANGATSYNVKRATSSGGPYSIVGSPAVATFTDTGVVNGTRYYYVVSAVNGSGESANSAEVSAVPAGVYAWLKFDETGGVTAADSGSGSWPGTLVNGPTWVAGRLNNAVHLDGANDYVTFGQGVVSGLNDFTISTWVKLDAVAGWARIFDFGSGPGVNMFLCPKTGANPAKFRFAITVNGGAGEQQINAGALAAGAWTHVAVTLAGNVGTLYVNGAQVGQNANMTLKPSSLGATTQNWIGQSQYGADPHLTGAVDEFRIYSRALSAAEIAALAQ